MKYVILLVLCKQEYYQALPTTVKLLNDAHTSFLMREVL